jgi:putative RecB family exonuclease
MEARTLSISQIQSYLLCPLKYRFQYVDRIPKPWRAASLSFGSSVHSAIEWFHCFVSASVGQVQGLI